MSQMGSAAKQEKTSPLKTVRVPAELEGPFLAAEKLVSDFFRRRTDDPEHGTIEIFGERYLMIRAASLSVEFFGQVEQLFGPERHAEADQFARNFLFDLGHAIGLFDARNFHKKMKLGDPIAKLSAGPVHFSHSGWANVDIFPESRPVPNDEFFLIYEHPFSFEADAWLRAGKPSKLPVCVMNAGYSSGWSEESFGIPLIASEILCKAKGDKSCRFIMAPPAKIEEHIRKYLGTKFKPGITQVTYEIPDFFARKRAEDARIEAEKGIRLREEFISIASHELKTPLTAIKMQYQVIFKVLHEIDFPNKERFLALFDSSLRNLDQFVKLIDELLDVSRIGAGHLILNRRLVFLAKIVSQVLDQCRPELERSRCAVSTDLDHSVQGNWDPVRIEQVIVNLLNNAMKYGCGTPIEITVQAAENQARLVVRDQGIGISKADQEKIFQRFERVAPISKFGGLGLGLYITRQIVEAHGGTIRVESETGKGAAFIVEIPV